MASGTARTGIRTGGAFQPLVPAILDAVTSSSTFIGGTVPYTASLVGLLLPETTFPARKPVREVLVECDGKKAELKVLLGPFDSEEVALAAARSEMLRVWGALLVGAADAFTSASEPIRGLHDLKRRPIPGVVFVSGAGAICSMGEVSISVGVSAQRLQTIRDISTGPSWNPSESLAFRLFERAIREPDAALQFLALYSAMVLSLETRATGEDEPDQEDVDAELLRLDTAIPLLRPEGDRRRKRRKPRDETPFTRARNRLLHPGDRGVSWDDAKAYAASQLQAFRLLVAKHVVDGTVGVP